MGKQMKFYNKNAWWFIIVANVLFIFGMILMASFISASDFGFNEIPQGFKTINQNVTTFQTIVNGTAVNASSFSTACSGTDKVSNVTYSNFSGFFTIVCTTDSTGGGLTWGDIINGTVYLSNNTYTFWNSTFATFNKTYADTLYYGIGNPNSYITWANAINGTLALNSSLAGYYPIVNPYTFWNSTFATFNKTYADTLYAPLGGSELDPYWSSNFSVFLNKFNATNFPNYANVYLNTTNQFSYFNATNFPNYANVYLNTTNQFNYTNKTLLSQFTNDLTFYVDNTHGYWNDTYATFNKTYADTLYRAFANHTINGNLIVANNFTVDTNLVLANSNTNFVGINLSDPKNTLNVFGDFNVTGIAYRSNKALIDWSEAFNGTLFKRADWDSNYSSNNDNWNNRTNQSYYLLINTFSFYNSTTWNNPYTYFNLTNFPNYANVYLNTTNQFGYINLTTLAGNETDPDAYNGTLRYMTNHTINGETTISNNLNITVGNSTVFLGRIKLGIDVQNCAGLVSGEICRNSTATYIKG